MHHVRRREGLAIVLDLGAEDARQAHQQFRRIGHRVHVPQQQQAGRIGERLHAERLVPLPRRQ